MVEVECWSEVGYNRIVCEGTADKTQISGMRKREREMICVYGVLRGMEGRKTGRVQEGPGKTVSSGHGSIAELMNSPPLWLPIQGRNKIKPVNIPTCSLWWGV